MKGLLGHDMKIDKLLIWPNKQLFQRSNKVENFDKDLEDTLKQMFVLMQTYNGAGFAAPQAGIMLRMFVMRRTEAECGLAIVNPEIIERSNETFENAEGCLSFPGVFIPIKRYASIKVRFQTENGDFVEMPFAQTEAGIVQHEIDHLDGIPFIKMLSELNKARIAPLLKKIKRSIKSHRSSQTQK